MVRPNMVVAASPGTLVAPPGSPKPAIRLISYSPEQILETTPQDPAELKAQMTPGMIHWVDVQGLGDVDTLVAVGEIFGLHRLALEDVLNMPQRPKLEEFPDHQFLVARMPVSKEHAGTEQLSLFSGESYVLTFQEQPGDSFDPIRKRLRDGRPRLREGAADYLVYAIVDAIVDSYFPVLQTLGEELDEIEEEVLQNPERSHSEHLNELKRDLVSLRRYIWPLREVVNGLLKEDNPLVTDSTRLYLRDCLDHAMHASDLVESYREISTGLMDLYLSMMSQRMNEVMKVLTIIATLFIPLSFIAGLYGMNFDPSTSRWNMPELAWPFGYPFALSVMALCAGAMLAYFWRKGWFR